MTQDFSINFPNFTLAIVSKCEVSRHESLKRLKTLVFIKETVCFGIRCFKFTIKKRTVPSLVVGATKFRHNVL